VELSDIPDTRPTATIAITDNRILGVSLLSGTAREAVERALHIGGLVVIPAAGLCLN
jgi:hypothetical protein